MINKNATYEICRYLELAQRQTSVFHHRVVVFVYPHSVQERRDDFPFDPYVVVQLRPGAFNDVKQSGATGYLNVFLVQMPIHGFDHDVECLTDEFDIFSAKQVEEFVHDLLQHVTTI